MATLTLAQLTQLARDHGFPDPALAAAVAMAESRGEPCAHGDPRGQFLCDGPNGTSSSFGLWQVHTPAHPQYDPTSLLDPDYNADAAYAISSGGTNWEPWSTYTQDDPSTGEPWYKKYYNGPAASGLTTGQKRLIAIAAAGGVLYWLHREGYLARLETKTRRLVRRYA